MGKLTDDEIRFEKIRIHANRIGGHSVHLLNEDQQGREQALTRTLRDVDEILDLCGKEKLEEPYIDVDHKGEKALTLRQGFEGLGRRMVRFTKRVDARIDGACAWINNLIK